MKSCYITIDTGGTFTDVIASINGKIIDILKLSSTPEYPQKAVIHAIELLKKKHHLKNKDIIEVRHATTIATNTLLEKKGANTVLITNDGFEDILLLRRQNRPQLYALHPFIPTSLIDRKNILGIKGRLNAKGEEIKILENIEKWIEIHHKTLEKCDNIAICLLHSYLSDKHEKAIKHVLKKIFPYKEIILSSSLAPLSREYERSATVVVNAYISLKMKKYLDSLEKNIAPILLEVMSSSGGLLPSKRIVSEPIHTIISGPVAGVQGAFQVGLECSRNKLLCLDMGGTSTDISIVYEQLETCDEVLIADHPLRIPLFPIETIGAGGGSIAFIDNGGILKVGPQSAGSYPGPACYGHDTENPSPTLTDAHIVLGRVESFLDGDFLLDKELAQKSIEKLAQQLNSKTEDVANAIIQIINANIVRACRRVIMKKGVNPSDLTFIAFGGAGGIHACEVADELGIKEVIFPDEPGVLSAKGMFFSPKESFVNRSIHLLENLWEDSLLKSYCDDIKRQSNEKFCLDFGTYFDENKIKNDIFLDCQYMGQSYSLSLNISLLGTDFSKKFTKKLRKAFDLKHKKHFGYSFDSTRLVEIVSIRSFTRILEPIKLLSSNEKEESIIKGPKYIKRYSGTFFLPSHWIAKTLKNGHILCAKEEIKTDFEILDNKLLLEIHRHRMSAIAEEMGESLMRSSFSANIKERKDFSCAIFNSKGELLVQAAHIPIHLGSQSISVKSAINDVKMYPGITIILNDPFSGGTHLPDITLVSPVYLKNDQKNPAFFVANRAHHSDIGGISFGSMPSSQSPCGKKRVLSIYDEGFCTSPVELTDDIRQDFSQSSRIPQERLGDLKAQESANYIGIKRLEEMLETCDYNYIHDLNEYLLLYSQICMENLIESIPNGVFYFTDYLDDDGFSKDIIPISVKITICKKNAIIDFSNVQKQSPSSMNTVQAIVVSSVFYVFQTLADNTIPANSGILRPIKIITRKGSLCDATKPSAVSAGNVETSQRLVDILFGALGKAMPMKIPAASGGSMNNILFGGKYNVENREEFFVYYETLACGAGASVKGDGADAIHTHMTNTLNTPIEELERLYPIQITCYAIRKNRKNPYSTYSGGSGIIRAYKFLCDAEITLITERRKISPWSIGGSVKACVGKNYLISNKGEYKILEGKTSLFVKYGDTIVIETPNGGNWSPPKNSLKKDNMR